MSTVSAPAWSGQRARGVLLIGHGTRDRTGTDQFFALGQRLAERMRPVPVESALLEFQRPTIAQGWDALVQQGVGHVHAAPLLLFAAGHAKQDIPDSIGQCRLSHPQVTFDQCRPLSRHPAIVELAAERARQAWSEINVPVARRAVVMVGRGNRDPCAQADMRVLTEVLSRRMDAGRTFTSFYAMAQPGLPEVLTQIAASGRFDAILIQPHLLFEGRLYQAILKQIDEASQQFPDIRFGHSEYLGPDTKVAEAIAGRIHEQMTVAGNADPR